MLSSIEYNKIFQLAADYINFSNRSIFLTGKAGTGKTTFLKFIRGNTSKEVAVLAPTGVAAINAGGATIHSLSVGNGNVFECKSVTPAGKLGDAITLLVIRITVGNGCTIGSGVILSSDTLLEDGTVIYGGDRQRRQRAKAADNNEIAIKPRLELLRKLLKRLAPPCCP